MTRTLAFAVFILVVWPSTMYGQTMNTLTAQETSQGWQLLFDGKTLAGWHASLPPQGRGRGGPSQPPPPGQIGTPKPCVTTTQAQSAPAGVSHWEVVDGLLTACG